MSCQVPTWQSDENIPLTCSFVMLYASVAKVRLQLACKATAQLICSAKKLLKWPLAPKEVASRLKKLTTARGNVLVFVEPELDCRPAARLASRRPNLTDWREVIETRESARDESG